MTAASIAERLGLPRRNDVAAVAATRDKRMLRRRLTEAGLDQPRYVEVDIDAGAAELDEAIRVVGLPCVVKPVDLAASRGVIRADSREQLDAAMQRVGALLRDICASGPLPPMIIEAYVDGVEIAVEGIVRDGVLDVIALFDKPDPLTGPFFEETLYVTPSRLRSAEQHRALDAVRAAVAALGLRHGPIHAEVRIEKKSAVVIEVAARSIGGLCSQVIRVIDADAPDEVRSLEEIILRQACGFRLGALRLADAACGVFMLPIARAGTLRAVTGIDHASAVDGVTSVAIAIPAGETVTPLPEGDRYLGFVFARGDTAAQVEAALRAAESLIRVDIDGDSPDGVRTRSRHEAQMPPGGIEPPSTG